MHKKQKPSVGDLVHYENPFDAEDFKFFGIVLCLFNNTHAYIRYSDGLFASSYLEKLSIIQKGRQIDET